MHCRRLRILRSFQRLLRGLVLALKLVELSLMLGTFCSGGLQVPALCFDFSLQRIQLRADCSPKRIGQQ
jgi:ABC-type arginine/histidine transport system permease subunit